MKCSEMWRVGYFYIPRGRWYTARLFRTLDEAVDHYIEMYGKDDIGAVRLYEPGYRPDSDYLWHDEKIDQNQRQLCAFAAVQNVD